MAGSRAFGIASLYFLCMIILAGCCDDCPECPREPVSDFDIYIISSEGGHPIYIYNTDQQEIIDSIPSLVSTGSQLLDMDISGDGTALLLSTQDNATIVAISSLDTIAQFDFGGKIEVSRTGKYIAFGGSDSLHILDGATLSLITDTSIANRTVKFSHDESLCYITDSSNSVYIYDIVGDSVYQTLTDFNGIGQFDFIVDAVPDISGDKLILITMHPEHESWLFDYSLSEDTITFRRWLNGYSIGEIRSTTDAELIIVTDPNQAGDGANYNHLIYIDMDVDQIQAFVGPGAYIQDSAMSARYLYPGDFVSTPDDRYTIVGGIRGCELFGIIDNTEQIFSQIISLPSGYGEKVFIGCAKK
ncbi:MAG: WD40 repeat domain-containing protein [Candidatus Zixiibacteriota bacterium]